MRCIHFDYYANNIRLELRSANVRYGATLVTIVPRRHVERGTFEIYDDAVGRFEREVVDVDRLIDSDDNLRFARCGNYTNRSNACAVRSDECKCRGDGEELLHCVLTFVESFIASVSWRL